MSSFAKHKRSRCYLAFPPGWSLCCGGPHVAIPALAAFLRENGVEVAAADLNLAWGYRHDVIIEDYQAECAMKTGTLDSMNTPYFAKEDLLQSLANEFDGEWNLQAGFSYCTDDVFEPSGALARALAGGPFSDILRGAAVADVAKFDPDVVALSVAAWQQFIPALEFAICLREAGFDGCIAIGGNTISRLADAIANFARFFDYVDVFAVFAGEVTLLEIVRNATRHQFGSVGGVLWRDAGGISRTTMPGRNRVARLPGPNFEGFAIGAYPGRNYLPIFLNRGCYYGKCTFCAIPYGWGHEGYDGARLVDDVVGDMIALSKRWNIRRFKFVDEAVHPRQLKDLALTMLKRGLHAEWEVYARLEAAWYDKAFVALMAKAGLRKAYFGLELLPSDDRDILGKRDTARPDALLRICAEYSVLVHLFCMFGYPGTSRRDAQQITEFVLRNASNVDTADFFPWTLAKHTIVPGVSPTNSQSQTLRLEFDHDGNGDNLSSAEIAVLAAEMEEFVWDEAPRLLHPIYRMVSPWACEVQKAASKEAAGLAARGAGGNGSFNELRDVALRGCRVPGDTSNGAVEICNVST